MPSSNGVGAPSYEDMPGTHIQAPAREPAERSAEVDLAAYARGEADYDLADVLRAIDRYALQQVEQLAARTARIETRRDAIAFIEAEGLVEADEVADLDDEDDNGDD